MNVQVLAQNIRRLRTKNHFSQRTLAVSSGISLPAIKNMELAKSKPRMKTVQAIARALDVKLHELFLPVRILKNVRFRSGKSKQYRENILADISRWLEDFNFLEEVLDERIHSRLNEVRDQCSREDIILSAKTCRVKLGLRETEPIYDICGLLENAGIKLYPISIFSDGFFGLSVGEDDGGPAIVVNVWKRIPVERRIFTAAHELGHLMLHREAYDVSQSEENAEEEREADLFAGHFLLPPQGFQKEWNEAAGLHLVDRVFKIKRIFHVSYKTVLVRLIESGAVDNSIWKRFNLAYQQRFNKKLPFKEEPMGIGTTEPFGLQRFDFYEDRFSRLVRKAIETDKISLSRGAEIFRIGIEEMQGLLENWKLVL